jgi:hypothetical protein
MSTLSGARTGAIDRFDPSTKVPCGASCVCDCICVWGGGVGNDDADADKEESANGRACEKRASADWYSSSESDMR